MTGYRAVGIEVTDAYYKLGSDRVKIALEAEQKASQRCSNVRVVFCFAPDWRFGRLQDDVMPFAGFI